MVPPNACESATSPGGAGLRLRREDEASIVAALLASMSEAPEAPSAWAKVSTQPLAPPEYTAVNRIDTHDLQLEAKPFAQGGSFEFKDE